MDKIYILHTLGDKGVVISICTLDQTKQMKKKSLVK